MTIKIEHKSDENKSIVCAEKIFKQLTEEYKDEFSDLKQETRGNMIDFSFKIRGMHVKGTISVEKDNIVIQSKLPFALKLFQKTIEDKIKENADKMLSECMQNLN